MAMMNLLELEIENNDEEVPRYAVKEEGIATMERAQPAANVAPSVTSCSSLLASATAAATAAADDLRPRLGSFVPIFEPLKVCLDDDSSIEDGDEDMFDDDAFTFGDEDFRALMSHESMKRAPAPVRSQAPQARGGPAAPSSPVPPGIAAQCSLSGDSLASYPDDREKAALSAPSTAASSIASLGTLTLASQASCTSMSKKTRSKRRVSLHNDVAVIPIPMRTEYPAMVKQRIWSSASELYQNAARNTIEFASEGFDWRNVADDSQMLQSPRGERIHPVHYANAYNLSCNLNCNREARSCGEEAGPTPIGMDVEALPS